MSKSIYDEFNEFDKDLIDLLLSSLKRREDVSHSILVKKYGPKLDGVNGNLFLPYFETTKLSSVIKRYREYLKFALKLRQAGKTDAEIKKIFQTKKDVDLINMMKNYLNSNDEKVYVRSKHAIFNDFKINEHNLIDALDGYEDSTAVKVFKMYYGIGEEKVSDKVIADVLNIKVYSIQDYLKKVRDALPNIIKDYKDYMTEYNKNKASKPKPAIKVDIYKNTFFENLIDNNLSKEDRIDLENKIIEYIELNKDNSVYSLIHILYGIDLKTYNKENNISEDNLTLIKEFKDELRKLIINKELDEELEKLKSSTELVELPKLKDSTVDISSKTFFDTIIDDNMSEEDKKRIEELIIKYLETHTSDTIKLIYDLYGKDLKHYNVNNNLTQSDKNHVSSFKNYIKRIVITGKMEQILEEKEPILYFNDFFSNIPLEEQEQAKEVVLDYIHTSSSIAAANTIKLYGYNLDTYNANVILTPQEIRAISNLKSRLKKGIESGKDYKKSSEGSRLSYFYQHFVDEEISNEEINKLNKKILDIFNSIDEYSEVKEYIKSIYGEDLSKEANFNIIIPKKYHTDDSSLKRKIKSLLKKKDDLFSIFIRDEIPLSEEEIKEFILNYIKTRKVMYERFSKAYGEDLLNVYDGSTLTPMERRYISATKQFLISRLKEYVKNDDMSNKTEYLISYFTEDCSSTDEIESIRNDVKKYIRSKKYMNDVFSKAYGTSLDEKYKIENLSKEEKRYVITTRWIIMNKIKNGELGIDGRKRTCKDLFNYYIKDSMSDEEKEKIKKSIIETIKNDEKMYSIFKKAYGEDLLGIYTSDNLSEEEKKYIKNIKQCLSNKLKRGTLVQIDEENTSSKMTKEDNITDIKIIQTIDENIKLDYIDSTILTLYTAYSIKQISIILNISIEEVLKSLMRSIDVNKEQEKLIDDILNEYPEFIDILLESKFMNEFMNTLTNKEKQLIYLKLKSISSKSITNELISKVINAPIDDVESYVVYNKDDRFDIINKMLKKLK